MGIHSLAEAAARFARVSIGLKIIDHACLEEAGQIIEAEAKRVIGTYDYGWPPLKPETIERKTTGDSPLLETGEMRDSIHHMVQGDKVFIGSDNEKAAFHEYGTSRGIPPRPFLSTAAQHKHAEVAKKIGKHYADAIIDSLIAGRMIAPVVTGIAVESQASGMAARIGRLFGRRK